MIKVRAYGKINLALEVKGEVNGYHEVNNIMVPISIFDEINMDKASKDNVYVLDGYYEDNIVEKALKLFKEKYFITECAEIEIIKRIPSEAGLAGGSSDAELFNIQAKDEELKEIAAKLGSDVPFFLDLLPAMCTGRGEIITPFEFEPFIFDLLLVKPDINLSTKKVYKKYVYENVSKADKLEKVKEALEKKDIELLKNNVFNDLEKTALDMNKDLKEFYDLLVKKGLKPHITGSGPTLFLINPSQEEINTVKELIIFSLTTLLLYFIITCKTFTKGGKHNEFIKKTWVVCLFRYYSFSTCFMCKGCWYTYK